MNRILKRRMISKSLKKPKYVQCHNLNNIFKILCNNFKNFFTMYIITDNYSIFEMLSTIAQIGNNYNVRIYASAEATERKFY